MGFLLRRGEGGCFQKGRFFALRNIWTAPKLFKTIDNLQ